MVRNSSTAQALPGHGEGTFGERLDVGAGAEPRNVAIANLNGDTRHDLATGSASGGIFVLRNIGTDRIATERFVLAAGVHEVALTVLEGLPPGVYVIRLRQSAHVATARVCRVG